MLKAQGLVVNRKRTYRLYTALGMQIRTRRRKKLHQPPIPMALPTRVNERWSLDFVHDPLANGRRIRVLNIIDDFSRKYVGQLVDTSISGARLARYLDELAMTRSLPTSIILDNGPELTSKAMFFWAQKTKVKLCFIQPGKPTQNAYVESFNGRLRDGCLNHNIGLDRSMMPGRSGTTGDITTTMCDHTVHQAIGHRPCSKQRLHDMMFLSLFEWLPNRGKVIIRVRNEDTSKTEEQWSGDYVFENEWQSFRTRKDRSLELASVQHEFPPGRRKIAIKVVDIFGNDTMKILEVRV